MKGDIEQVGLIIAVALILITWMILFAGDPDLHDALIHHLTAGAIPTGGTR